MAGLSVTMFDLLVIDRAVCVLRACQASRIKHASQACSKQICNGALKQPLPHTGMHVGCLEFVIDHLTLKADGYNT